MRRLHRHGLAHALAPAAVLLGLAAAACTPIGLATTAGAVAATAAQEERGLDGATRDTLIRAAINKAWLDHDHRLLVNASLIVHERRVLLTGVMDTSEMADTAVRLAWQADGVVDVINELRISPDRDLGDRTRDALISSEISRSLLFDSEIKSINYAVDVVERTVYVMGIAQNQSELDRVLSWARNTDYVRRVVNHVRLKNDPSRVGPRGEGS
jgi:osmotically-inducible protein OsmY